MLKLEQSTKFKKDLKLIRRRGLDISKLRNVIQKLMNEEELEEKYHDHNLGGNWEGHRECHIAPDWLLIYKVDKGNLILTAMRTGTHSDLFT